MSKEPVTHAEVRQLLMSDITHDDDCDTMHRYVNEQEAEIARLKGELRIKTAYVDRAPFCGDCRDKVAGLPCLRCENQRLKAELATLHATIDRNHHANVDAAKSYPGIHGESFSPTEAIAWYEEQLTRLKAELAEAINQRDEAQGRIFGAKELASEALRALKHAEKAITREAWQSGPTIEEARKSLLDASKNIEDYGVDGYANALKTVRLLAAMKMKERDSANADADLLGREVAAWRKWKSEYHAAALTWTGTDLTKARADTDARSTAAARVKGADVGLQSAIDRHVAKSAEIVSRIPPRNRTILSKREAQERGPWWLIERSQPEGQDPPCWWNEVTEKWEKDASAATRWETKAEAETVLSKREGIRGVHSQWGHVSEHIFI